MGVLVFGGSKQFLVTAQKYRSQDIAVAEYPDVNGV
jgi:hypothetical protein